jgi:hypothetical protein
MQLTCSFSVSAEASADERGQSTSGAGFWSIVCLLTYEYKSVQTLSRLGRMFTYRRLLGRLKVLLAVAVGCKHEFVGCKLCFLRLFQTRDQIFAPEPMPASLTNIVPNPVFTKEASFSYILLHSDKNKIS